jgi:hypothetical protein
MKAVPPEVERELREIRHSHRSVYDFVITTLARHDRRLAELEATALRTPLDIPNDFEEAA